MLDSHTHLSHPKYRSDIDGLRAIAILSVVAYHAFPSWIRGGFIGVDIFFVISGFLISTIIFENLDKRTFSFTEFYARRIKRIFPALILVLITCYAFGWFVLLADEYKQLGKHIAAGAGFVSNFVLWKETGYFDNSAETKPLLHLWSLGVEEQFYIVWPLLLWFAWKRKFNLLTITVLIAALSFYLNAKGIKKDAVATFYSPQTRFWELMSGSLLAWVSLYQKTSLDNIKVTLDSLLAAVLHREKPKDNDKTLSNVLSFLGLFLLAFGFWRINKSLSFPGKWALVPVLGAVLIIAAGPKAWANRTLLSNKLAVWFGLISFPLYLWHWPLLSFARIIESDEPSRNIRIITILISILLAWLTYKLIECPVRSRINGKAPILILLGLLCAAGISGYFTFTQDGLAFRNKGFSVNYSQFNKPDYPQYNAKCHSLFIDYEGHCIASTKINSIESTSIIFLGDSHSEALSMGEISMGNISSEGGPTFISIGRGGCPPLKGVERFTENGPQNCPKYYDPFFNLIGVENLSNTILVITARYSAYVEGWGFGDIDNSNRKPGSLHIQKIGPRVDKVEGLYEKIFSEGLDDTLRLSLGKFKKIIVVLQVPELGFDPKQCLLRPLAPIQKRCSLPRADVLKRQEKYRSIFLLTKAHFPSVIFYDPLDLFCDQTECFAVHQGKMLYRDDDHISLFGAEAIISDMVKKDLL